MATAVGLPPSVGVLWTPTPLQCLLLNGAGTRLWGASATAEV